MNLAEAMSIVPPVSSPLSGSGLSSSCDSDWSNATVPVSEMVEHGRFRFFLAPITLSLLGSKAVVSQDVSYLVADAFRLL